MKLSELAESSGASASTLKHWIRVGVLPAGRLRNKTTAVYDQSHLDRALLIRAMREEHGASLDEVRTLTTLIDTEGTTTVEVMNACQEFIWGIPNDVATDDAYEPFRERTYELMRRRGWRGYPGAAERGMTHALAVASEVGLDYDVERLMEYADAVEPLATKHVAALGPGSADVIARRMLAVVTARARQLLAISNLAHAAVSVRGAIERGDLPPQAAMPPAPEATKAS